MIDPIRPIEPTKPSQPNKNITMCKDVLLIYSDSGKRDKLVFIDSSGGIEAFDPDGEKGAFNVHPYQYPAMHLIELFSSEFSVPQESIYFDAWVHDADYSYLSLKSIIPNTNYSIDLKGYELKMEEYKSDLKEYKTKLIEYKEQKKKYSIYKRLERAKSDLAKLDEAL